MKNTIMVVAAHPDDEVLGCGGTIRRLADEGHDIYIAILGEGLTSRCNQREDADNKNIEMLKKVSQKVSRLLGAKDVIMCDLPDNRFDAMPLLDVIKKVEHLINKYKPEIIFTHHGSDLNIDHQITSRAVITATRPIKDEPVRGIYAFEIPSSTEWSFGQIGPVFSPNVFYDISKTVENKIEALKFYESECREFPHPRSAKAIAAIAERWGSVAGVPAAEAFELVRKIY